MNTLTPTGVANNQFLLSKPTYFVEEKVTRSKKLSISQHVSSS